MYGLLRCRRCSLVKALLVKQCNDQAMFCSIFAFQVYPETKTEKFKTQLSLSLRFYSSNVSSHVATVELLTPKNSQSTPKWTKRWQIKGKKRKRAEAKQTGSKSWFSFASSPATGKALRWRWRWPRSRSWSRPYWRTLWFVCLFISFTPFVCLFFLSL